MLKNLKSVVIGGKEVNPIIEGGKGVAVSTGATAGAFAATNSVGTFSGVNANWLDDNGEIIPLIYKGKTRLERHKELIEYSIKGGISQAKRAFDVAKDKGRIHMNVLWEMAGVQKVLHGVLEGAKGLIHGVTCGAGMPYKLADISKQYNIHYYPIVSSMRAFRALWKRSYSKTKELLGGVVYEDPWRAGGHNGLSNVEDPLKPQDPYPRVAEIRKFMDSVGLEDVPIIMAGGVWYLRDWQDWLDNKEIGPVAFQFGTRPLLTQESPIPADWKSTILDLKEGEVALNKFSPTGFYSSAVNNDFIGELYQRSARQVAYSRDPHDDMTEAMTFGPRARNVYMSAENKQKAQEWITQGFTESLRTPDNTLIFVDPAKRDEIIKDQVDCMGCLSHCQFSNWKDHDDYTTGHRADPRSYCIQKTLQNAIEGTEVNNNLVFAGHGAFNFAKDPFYANGNIPTVAQLVDRIKTGD